MNMKDLRHFVTYFINSSLPSVMEVMEGDGWTGTKQNRKSLGKTDFQGKKLILMII